MHLCMSDGIQMEEQGENICVIWVYPDIFLVDETRNCGLYNDKAGQLKAWLKVPQLSFHIIYSARHVIQTC